VACLGAPNTEFEPVRLWELSRHGAPYATEAVVRDPRRLRVGDWRAHPAGDGTVRAPAGAVSPKAWLLGTRLNSPFPDPHDVVTGFEMTLGDGLSSRIGDRGRIDSHFAHPATGDAPHDE
jgi:hypothetical protein